MKKTLLCLLAALVLVLGTGTLAHADYAFATVYNTASLNVRSGPSASYPWVGALQENEQVRVNGESGNWYLISTLDGKLTGYASKNYLRITGTPTGAQSVTPGTYAVVYNTESLNLRAGPDASYQWLGSLAKENWVKILGQSGNWYQVTYTLEGNTYSGYMSKSFLKTTENASAGSLATVQNPAGTRFLNLRAYPSYSADVLGIFYNGAQCTVLDRQSDGWYRVSINREGERLEGYFRSEYLMLGGVSSARVNTSSGTGGSLNLRMAPSYDAAVSRQIPNGATVSVKLKGKEFWMVEYDGTLGFAAAGFLGGQSAGNPGGMPSGSGSIGDQAVVQTGNSGSLNLREQANANSRILARYYSGTRVEIIERGTGWCLVKIEGNIGYVMTKFLSISGTSVSKRVDNTNGGSYVNLRSSPEKKSGNVNVRVPDGAYVNLLSWGEVWSQVSYNGNTGYMMSWFLK